MVAGRGFRVFDAAAEAGGVVRAITVPGGADKISASRLKKGDVAEEAGKAGAKGLPFLKVTKEGGYGRGGGGGMGVGGGRRTGKDEKESEGKGCCLWAE